MTGTQGEVRAPTAQELIFSPPAAYYTDPKIFDLEKEKIFYKSWLQVCHVSELSQPGDYLVKKIIDQEILVIRDWNGELHASYNVCAHRASRLLAGKGNCGKVIACPYHAWTYHLNGELRSAPNSKNVPGFEASKFALVSVRLEVFCGLIYVNLDADGQSLKQLTGNLDNEIREYFPTIENFRFFEERVMDHECNWKVSIENSNECYHCSVVHQTLGKTVLDISSHRIWTDGITIRGSARGRASAMGDRQVGSKDNYRNTDMASFFIWPNSVVVCYPGRILSTRQFVPLGQRRTAYIVRWYSDGTTNDETLSAVVERHATTNGQEDTVIVKGVQKGVESRGYQRGPLMIDGTDGEHGEQGVEYFQRLVRLALMDQSASSPGP